MVITWILVVFSFGKYEIVAWVILKRPTTVGFTTTVGEKLAVAGIWGQFIVLKPSTYSKYSFRKIASCKLTFNAALKVKKKQINRFK